MRTIRAHHHCIIVAAEIMLKYFLFVLSYMFALELPLLPERTVSTCRWKCRKERNFDKAVKDLR